MVEIDPQTLGRMAVGGYDVPLVNLSDVPEPPRILSLAGHPYVFSRSYLRLGYQGLLPGQLEELLAQGKDRLLIGERQERLYLYIAQG